MRSPFLACAALAVTLTSSVPNAAFAQMLAGTMTCQQAKAEFEANGRVYIRRGAEILPIYGGVPLSRQNTLRCERFDPRVSMVVRTADRGSCVLGYRCQ